MMKNDQNIDIMIKLQEPVVGNPTLKSLFDQQK